MKTLRGYEAIEIAQLYSIPLYDLQHQTERPVESVREDIAHGRNPHDFVIDGWPESEEEGQRIVLAYFHRALKERHWHEVRVADVIAEPEWAFPLHPVAAEWAAERLAEQGQLELVDARGESPLYRIPRTVYFRASFLETLRTLVCEECATLNVEEPFHEACLQNVLEFLRHNHFRLGDIAEQYLLPSARPRAVRRVRTGAGMRWLTQTAKAAKARWQTALRLRSRLSGAAEDAVPSSGADEPRTSWAAGGAGPAGGAGAAAEGAMAATGDGMDGVRAAGGGAAAAAAAGDEVPAGPGAQAGAPTAPRRADAAGAARITKQQLIRYLQQVEIIDEDGALARQVAELRREREALLQEVERKEREIERVEKQRAYAEQQCAEMQRDMDILIQAIQIAKRREQAQPSSRVIDASYEGDDA